MPPTLHKIASLPPKSDRTWQSAPHPTLPLLATSCSDKAVHISSLTNYKPLSTVEGGHKRSIRSVAWKPGSKGESVLATGSFDATAGIWRRYETDDALGGGRVRGEDDDAGVDDEEEEVEDWKFSVVLDGHENEVKSVAWSAGGVYLATCSRDKSVWIWEDMDEDNFETIAVLQDHTQDVKCVVWHPEEELLASCSYDDTIRLYKEDIDDWTCSTLLTGHTSTVWSIDFERKPYPGKSLSQSRLASASDDLTVRVWSRVFPPSNSSSSTKDEPATKIPSILKSSSVDEEWVQEAILPRAHTRTVYSVAWSSRHPGRIVTCGGDGKVILYQEVEVSPEESYSQPTEILPPTTTTTSTDSPGAINTTHPSQSLAPAPHTKKPTKTWTILAETPLAHTVYEVNNVCFSKRWDKKGTITEEEEIIISTGDDGVVNFWEIVEG